MSEAWHSRVLAATFDLMAPLPDVRMDATRFDLDRDRRILDLTNYLWKGFPLSLSWGEAVYGDALLLDSLARLPAVREQASNVYAAARLAFLQEAFRTQDEILRDLTAYDRGRAKDQTVGRQLAPPELARIGRPLPPAARIVFFRHDIVPFAQAVQYYSGLRAPRPVMAKLRPDRAETALAVYVRDGRNLVLDVSTFGFEE